jgi:hypothetical protein
MALVPEVSGTWVCYRSFGTLSEAALRWIFPYDVEEYYWAEPSFVARRKNLTFFSRVVIFSSQIRSLDFKSTLVHLLSTNKK